MNIDILSTNIKRYRTKKKLTQPELAERSGVSLPTIKNIERKKSLPRTNTLLDLSKALDCRLQDLVVPVKEISSVRFRAKKKMNRREQVLAQVSKWLDDFGFLEDLLSERQDYRFKDLIKASKKTDPIELAGDARKILRLKDDEPIHDISGLIESSGIKLLTLPYASDAFNGLSVGVDDQGPAIIINTWDRISVERQIFSAAHELGHLLMHLSDYDGKELEEDKTREKEADLFAGYFLMPAKGFDSEWAETAGLPFVERVMKIKSIFKVSYKTVLYRLIQKGVVDRSIWQLFPRLFYAKYRKKLTFKEEPFGDDSEPFKLKPFNFTADRLSRLVRNAIETDQISISRAAEILNLSSEQMMNLASEWETYA
jgi:Zn-dependent peptidase ImmA (M78 family)/DNA-binding XRE family transcriptional regulator